MKGIQYMTPRGVISLTVLISRVYIVSSIINSIRLEKVSCKGIRNQTLF